MRTVKMQVHTDLIKKELKRLLPLSIVQDVAVFVFYDNHPRDARNLDITVCTRNGEIQEYFQRDLIASYRIKVTSMPTEIIILRNSSSDLYYTVATRDQVFIVSSKDGTMRVRVQDELLDVISYGVDDWAGIGQTFLKVCREKLEDVVYDENFQRFDADFNTAQSMAAQNRPIGPIFPDLKRKFIEAQHSVRNNEKSIADYVKLRHAATIFAYQDTSPHQGGLQKDSNNMYGWLSVKTQQPWVKVCNSKLIVVLNVLNEYKKPIKEVQILLNSDVGTLVYTTKVFTKTNTLPFWTEHTPTLLPKMKAAVVAVIAMDELQQASHIVVSGALSYRIAKKSLMIPFEDQVISPMMSCGDAFDALSSDVCDANMMLAIMSTTQSADLRVRRLTPGKPLLDLLTEHLQMERIGPNTVLYKKSPYHALNGAMMHFSDGTDKSASVTSYTRTKHQLLQLIQSIIDMVPAKIIITPAHYALIAKVEDVAAFSEPIQDTTNIDYLGYAETVLDRTACILEYLDWSMMKMNESRDENVLRQIGQQIDLYGVGSKEYIKFRDEMLQHCKKGVQCLLKKAGDAGAMDVD